MRIALLSLIALFGFSAAAFAAPQADHAWLRVVSGQVNGAGYLTLSNPGDKADTLVGVTSDCCQAVEIHSMKMSGDTMMMQKMSQMPISAGGKLTFAPMGNHIMFIGFAQTPDSDDTVTATLHFASGHVVPVNFVVTQIGGVAQ